MKKAQHRHTGAGTDGHGVAPGAGGSGPFNFHLDHVPALLAFDAEAARKIRGSVIEVDDTILHHEFQRELWEIIHRFEPRRLRSRGAGTGRGRADEDAPDQHDIAGAIRPAVRAAPRPRAPECRSRKSLVRIHPQLGDHFDVAAASEPMGSRPTSSVRERPRIPGRGSRHALEHGLGLRPTFRAIRITGIAGYSIAP